MKHEIRTYSVSLRALRDAQEDDLFILDGKAASYNVLSPDLGGFRERIAPGAFDRSIREAHDVKCLLNHDPSKVLGRTTSRTLQLSAYQACGLGPQKSPTTAAK